MKNRNGLFWLIILLSVIATIVALLLVPGLSAAKVTFIIWAFTLVIISDCIAKYQTFNWINNFRFDARDYSEETLLKMSASVKSYAKVHMYPLIGVHLLSMLLHSPIYVDFVAFFIVILKFSFGIYGTLRQFDTK